MSSTRCGFSAATALRSVILPLRIESVKPRRLQISAVWPAPKTQFRPYGFKSRKTGKGKPDDEEPRARYKLDRFPRDDEITYPLVHVRQEGDATLSDPTPTHLVLEGLNPEFESLVVVALPEADKDDEGGIRYPICKIINKKAERNLAKDRRTQERKKAVRFKEMEINWAIDPHDLGHRLDKVRAFLQKGLTVEVRLLNRKHKRKATQEEAEEVLQQVKELVSEVPGAKESRPREGQLLESMKLFLEAPQPSTDKKS